MALKYLSVVEPGVIGSIPPSSRGPLLNINGLFVLRISLFSAALQQKFLLAMTSTSSQPPKAKALGTHSNGILPISASATQQRAAPSLIIKPSNRVSTSRLKVVARNLPPNLTLAEFEAILGEEWKVNGRRVDWFSFKPGKVSKKYEDPLKPFWMASDKKLAIL